MDRRGGRQDLAESTRFRPRRGEGKIVLLGRLLRETARSRAARLESALVFQRRWPLARWRGLYECHPLLANRREIAVTRDRRLPAGVLRPRSGKRGWFRGSVVDAGGISSYVKSYPLAGVEIILPTGNFWIGCDPVEEIELEAAYFVRAGSVEHGSCVYDEPGPDDPRVMRFREPARAPMTP